MFDFVSVIDKAFTLVVYKNKKENRIKSSFLVTKQH